MKVTIIPIESIPPIARKTDYTPLFDAAYSLRAGEAIRVDFDSRIGAHRADMALKATLKRRGRTGVQVTRRGTVVFVSMPAASNGQ